VFIASLAGSLHCIGMCGGLVVVAGGGGGRAQLLGQVWYHVGRGIAYVSLGALAGLAGSESMEFLRALRFHAPWWVVIGVLLLVTSCAFILVRSSRQHSPQVRLGASASLRHRLWRSIASMPFVLGLVTPLLPCPWLYSFVVVAALSGSVQHGALTMSAFWLGTVPALLVVGTVFERATRAYARRMPVVTAIALAIAGSLSVCVHYIHR
jgi:sulfite exporter TauE/SafE